MAIKIALAGNPNSGKTTLFNALTGSNQFVGNWPGVTVEKKEGRLKNNKDVVIMDLPGIYSLSPYTLEEVISRNYLIDDKPDAILNIVDGTNLERNLYLTTQLTELGIPVVVAVNMMDIVKKNGDSVYTDNMSKELGCPVVEISALKGTGVMEAAAAAIKAAQGKHGIPKHKFNTDIEKALSSITETLLKDQPEKLQRWYSIKLFERDEKAIAKLNISKDKLDKIEPAIKACEDKFDDDSESIITGERYGYIDSIIKKCCKLKSRGQLTTSDKIDRVVTNRFLAIPIFVVVMFIVYYISVTSVGAWVTDWTNDGLFGDGWFMFGNGRDAYEEVLGDFDVASVEVEAYLEAAEEAGIDIEAISATLEEEEADETVIADFVAAADAAGVEAIAEIENEDGEIEETLTVTAAEFESALTVEEPDPADYGTWVNGVPVVIENALNAVGCADWLQGLILDGIVGGVGAVLGFVPQILVLFIFLAILESCGYMARIAFILDRIFRRFGLSGKSFIPMLIGTGCGIPGIMATRTIENERDRRMTILTTTFMPCGAKLPIIALIAGALFGGAWWVAPSAYFIGIAAVIVTGIMLKKTKMFEGEAAPFVMELPAYHLPTVSGVLRSMWERGWSFIKKAGTIILLSCVFIWFVSRFGFVNGSFSMLEEDQLDLSLLASIGNAIAWIFTPLGWGDWKAAVAAVMGLVAKENVVGTMGILYGFGEVAENGREFWTAMAMEYTTLSAYSFLVFNLLCAPCFAAMGAIKREMNNTKWFWFAVGYQCIFAYMVALVIYQIGSVVTGGAFGIGTVAAIVLIVAFIYLLFRKPSSASHRGVNAKQGVSA